MFLRKEDKGWLYGKNDNKTIQATFWGLRLDEVVKAEIFAPMQQAFTDVVLAYHNNKVHWNTITPGGDMPEKESKRMIGLSYDLINPQSVFVLKNGNGNVA